MVYKTTLKSFFFFLVFCLFFVGLGFGQSIFTNPITGTNPGASNPYKIGEIVDSNITVSGIGRGLGAETTIATNDRYNADSWNTTTIDPTAYFEFTITPNSGYEIDFASFEYTGQRSNEGPPNIEIRSSLDGYSSNIGTQSLVALLESPNTIDLSEPSFQNVSTSITFRVYGWGATHGNGSFSINDFTFNGVVSTLPICSGTPTTWDGSVWDNVTGPDLATPAIINGNYNTGTNGSFSACSLTVNAGATLTISDEDNGSLINTYVLVQTDLMVDGTIEMEPKASFVQLDDNGLVSVTGTIKVSKNTAPMNAWYEYTYWSSPVSGAPIGTALADSNANRRFLFNAQNFLDATMETGNNNAQVSGQDDIDDNSNDWQWVNSATVMEPGVGYAATLSQFAYDIAPGTSNKQFRITFEGPFNNGKITVPVYRNDYEPDDNNWNLIGNPYPSAIDADLFLNANSNIDVNIDTPSTLNGAIFLWSQNTPPSSTANGNEQLNFSSSDYAIINGIGQTAGGDGVIPERKIPSGQAFFVSYSHTAIPLSITPNGDGHDIAEGEVVFNNSMRVIGASDNAQFFKNSTTKSNSTSVANKLWVNLTSDNGVFNQTLIGYVKGATNTDDGSYFDTEKNISTGTSAILYTTMDNSNKKFAIQGKAENGLNISETINLGFKTSINVATIYTLSIAQLQGEFLTSNTIYLKDNLLDKVHNLSEGDYTFTSEIGEFNDRFVVMFNNLSLSTNELLANTNTLKIIDLNNDQVQFTVSNDVMIKKVSIFNILGKELYHFKGQSNSETYHLSNLKSNIYIAKVELSNGAVITKKAVKK